MAAEITSPESAGSNPLKSAPTEYSTLLRGCAACAETPTNITATTIAVSNREVARGGRIVKRQRSTVSFLARRGPWLAHLAAVPPDFVLRLRVNPGLFRTKPARMAAMQAGTPIAEWVPSASLSGSAA